MATDTPDLDTLFCAAIEIAAAEGRAAYLARACAHDPGLRERVERLVWAHFQAGSFLEEPALGPGATGAVAPAPEGSPAPAADPEGPGTRVGPYQLLEPLGEGGMGTVWKAQQTEPVRRRVALKLIKPGLDSRQVIA